MYLKTYWFANKNSQQSIIIRSDFLRHNNYGIIDNRIELVYLEWFFLTIIILLDFLFWNNSQHQWRSVLELIGIATQPVFTKTYGQRGNLVLLFENYKFSQKQLTKVGQKWNCTRKDCNVTFFTDVQMKRLVRAPDQEHHHPPPENPAKQHSVANSAKRKALGI